MKMIIISGAAVMAAVGLTACGASAPAAQPSALTSRSAPPTPAVTKTIIKHERVVVTHTPSPAVSTVPDPATVPNVTNPWAVVSAYYGDVESGDFPEAWALLSSGMVTGQTYQEFVAGYACTGGQDLTELSESGDQVSFDLAATNNCTGTVQYYTGTDTVVNGKIVAANVTEAG
jgi:hypothetical protein